MSAYISHRATTSMFSLETLSISYFTSSSVQSEDIFATKAPSDYSNCLGVT